jgi:hypothetical protein
LHFTGGLVVVTFATADLYPLTSTAIFGDKRAAAGGPKCELHGRHGCQKCCRLIFCLLVSAEGHDEELNLLSE